MKATSGELPLGDEWWYEIKWDGMRLIVTVSGTEVTLTSANGKDATASYPELLGLGADLGVDFATLDGEVVVFGDDGQPSFGALQHRMHITNARQAAERSAAFPAVLCLFDLLELDGNDLTGLPLQDRRRVLESLIEPSTHWRIPAIYDDGEALLTIASEQGLEGVIAKRTQSIYRPGTRTREWLKVKIRRRQEFVVGGWAPGTGNRTDGIGGLLIGHHPTDDAGRPRSALRYAGRVGSGLSQLELSTLRDLFSSLVTDECPFDPPPPPLQARGATWVEPLVVIEVEYAEWTSDGILRHPTYRGRRTDVDPDEVTAAP